MNSQLPEFSDFFENIDCTLSQEQAATCEGEVTLEECYNALKIMAANKSPGSDGFTTEFWNLLGN